MPKLSTQSHYISLVHLLFRGWRKGRAMHDSLMWSLLLVSLFLPIVSLITGSMLTLQGLWVTLMSPLFWLLPMIVLGALVMRLYYLATLVGCVRQINLSEDGQPSLCQIDLGHRECCKHVGPDGDKTDCPHWRPELVLD